MENINIYMFHYGPSNVPKFVREIESLEGVNLVLGPSREDHQELLKIKYYKEAFNKKIWSFMSDIWRAWKPLKSGPGLYMDTSFEMKNIDSFKFFLKSLDGNNFFVKEKPWKIASCFFYLKDMEIAEKYLKIYKKYNKNIYKFPIAPEILTEILSFKFDFQGYKDCKIKNTTFVSALPILGGNFGIHKRGNASWNKLAPNWWKKRTASRYWNSILLKWNEHSF